MTRTLNLSELLEIWHERAAIMEFDAGLDRQEAERRAWVEVESMKSRSSARLG